MSEDEVIDVIRKHVEKQFPKVCRACGRQYDSLKDYLQNTGHIGEPHSYDAELGNWQPSAPFGTFSFADCECGNTLVIGSTGMGVATMCRLLWWAKKEKSRRKILVGELLNELRAKIDKQVLAE